jgi:hypothetical protein
MEKTAFFYPEQSSKTSSKSPSDLVNEQVKDSERQNNFIINLTEGKANMREKFTDGYGRTLNVPKVLPVGEIPGPSFNNAMYIGEKCVGNHCGLSIDPSVTNYIANLHNTPSGAKYHFQSTLRPGNNSESLPWLKTYTGTTVNYGPYAFNVAPDNHSDYAKF